MRQRCFVPVFGEEVHVGDWGYHLHFAQRPAGRVHAVFWQFDRQQTLAGKRLQGSVHGAAGERLMSLQLVHKGKVLNAETSQ